MNKIICVDIDDTIAELSKDATTLCNNLTGKSVHPSQWYVYDVNAVFGISEEEYFNAVIQTKLLENLKPVYGAQSVLHSLEQTGYAIHYVTARAWHSDAYNVTLDWLRMSHFPIYKPINQDCLHVVPLDCNKVEYVAEHIGKEIAIAVDDSPTQVKNYIDSGICKYVFMVDRPWNGDDTELNSHRIKHISHLMNPTRF